MFVSCFSSNSLSVYKVLKNTTAVALLSLIALPAFAMDTNQQEKNKHFIIRADFLEYPEDISTGLVAKADDFTKPVNSLAISLNNIYYLKMVPEHYKSEMEVLDYYWEKGKGKKTNNTDYDFKSKVSYMVPKKEIELVEMSEMKILKPNNMENKTSLVTLHVYPCVALAAYNKANKYIGLAHIPGSPVDSDLEQGKNPLLSYSKKTSRERIEEPLLEKSVLKFLNEMQENTEKDDLELHLFGGHFNRLLLVQLIDLIAKQGYKLNLENIHQGRYEPSAPHRSQTFNIEINSEGNVYVLKNDHSIKVQNMFDAGLIKEAQEESSKGSSSDMLSSIAYSVIPQFLSQAHQNRSNQFEKIYFKELKETSSQTIVITQSSEEPANDTYTYYAPIRHELSLIQEVEEKLDLIYKLTEEHFNFLPELQANDPSLGIKEIKNSLYHILESICTSHMNFFHDQAIVKFRQLYHYAPLWLDRVENAKQQDIRLILRTEYEQYIKPLLLSFSQDYSYRNNSYNENMIRAIKDQITLKCCEDATLPIEDRIIKLGGICVDEAMKKKAALMLLAIARNENNDISHRKKAAEILQYSWEKEIRDEYEALPPVLKW